MPPWPAGYGCCAPTGPRQRYHHTELGGNFRLDELQAALLRVKLPHLPRWTEARRTAAARYLDLLADRSRWHRAATGRSRLRLEPVRDPGAGRHVGTGVAQALAARGIATAVYYPVPLHLQACFRSLGHGPGDFPHAELACQEVLALPCTRRSPPPRSTRWPRPCARCEPAVSFQPSAFSPDQSRPQDRKAASRECLWL